MRLFNKPFVLPLVVTFFYSQSTYSIDIYLFKSQKYLGDNNCIQGAANAITREFHYHGIKTNIINTYEANIKVTKNSISLFSSVEGITKWNNIKQQNTTFSVFLAHQWWDSLLQSLPDKPSLNLIAVPQYTISSAIKELAIKYGVPLVGTNGVCGNLQKTDLIKAYENSSIPRNTTYTLVLLAGDTQDTAGNWKLYSQKEAIKLAHVIAKNYLETGNTILVTNGPRTGKIVLANGKETNVHHDLDKVSQVFLAELEKKVPAKKILFYNFKYDSPTILTAAMGAVLKNKGSHFYIPGESISTISQAILLLPASSIILYEHSAMSKLHRDYVKEELKLGCASTIDFTGKRNNVATVTNKKCLVNQCDLIAHSVYSLYTKK